MTATALLGVFVALGVVLALLLVALRVLRRFAPTLGGALGGRTRLPMEVVQRLPLGPKHSIAVVRVGDRVLTVAVGEGGVQALGEIDGEDRARVLATSQAVTPFEGSDAAARGVAAVGNAFGAGALANRPELAALRALIPGVRRTTSPATPEPAAPAAPPRTPVLAGADAFRAVLGVALTSATKLVALVAVSALAAPAAFAQTPVAAPTPAQATALPALPAATQAALVQAAARQAAAPPGATQPSATQPSATPPSATRAAPAAAPAPARPAAADTMLARLAPQLDLRVGGGGAAADGGLRLSGTVGVVIMMGLMTLLPTLVLMMTGFTRILIVLQFLKQALGTQSAPPNHLVAAMALLLTGFVMAPTITEANRTAIQPWLAGQMEQAEMLKVGVKPFREFMLAQTRERDLQTFVEMSQPAEAPKTVEDVPLVVVMSAFVVSELRTAFQLGFALFLPFIVIDVVVSSVLMSMGMFMLPPAMIALPFKLLLFVLVDGWTLVVQSVVQSFR